MNKSFKVFALSGLIFLVTGCSLVCPATKTEQKDNISTYGDYPSSKTYNFSSYCSDSALRDSNCPGYTGYGYDHRHDGDNAGRHQHEVPLTPEQQQQKIAAEVKQKQMANQVEVVKRQAEYEAAKPYIEEKKQEYQQQQQRNQATVEYTQKVQQMNYEVEANKAKVQYEIEKNRQEEKKREEEQHQQQQQQQFQIQQMQQAIQNPAFRFPGR
jgi:hypothetical protein